MFEVWVVYIESGYFGIKANLNDCFVLVHSLLFFLLLCSQVFLLFSLFKAFLITFFFFLSFLRYFTQSRSLVLVLRSSYVL